MLCPYMLTAFEGVWNAEITRGFRRRTGTGAYF